MTTIGACGAAVGLTIAGTAPAQAAESPGLSSPSGPGATYYGPSGTAGSGAAAADSGWACTIYPENPTRPFSDLLVASGNQFCSGDLSGQTLTVYLKNWDTTNERWVRITGGTHRSGGLGMLSASDEYFCEPTTTGKDYRSEVVGTGVGPSGASTATAYSNTVTFNCA
ncbi:hypothetical protein [Parafrankia sp. EUN1f]|uniref:hypothetical protein n=1 Tax=Parafrankia sp. EUN1f TaxID=102897 RepID=UPI0012F75314|nr:hypothetical protein [Parafrankia sp. EUN1f]